MPLVANGVGHVYRRGEPGEAHALDGIDLTISGGEFTLVGGAGGSGKSTLLHCLSGLLRPTKGTVRIDGPAALSIQFPERALFADTVLDDIAFGPLNTGLEKGEARTRALEAAGKVGLDAGLLSRLPRTLSHGQRRLAALAGVIAMRPRYLFLDEPTAGLDMAAKERVVETLVRLNREGTAVIVASHDLAHFMDACSRMLVMSRGKVVFDDRPDGLVSLDDTMGLALPPSLIVARWLRTRGIEAPWNIGPSEAAAHIRRAHEGLD
ncbi:putative cobalt ABC transporter ATP binding protein [Methanocella paludicola SANAE]|uniref:Cobalt ABC transporter ATP binding protein n=1 Tax=Methanocella paludicola (strain DSM 17711 / JCM 13418 / NBRC 101707 / SANAE) TaxID=304371 RepID=D1YVI1_METPS|nr:ATP-binding cassette domain-containing protein [Methanocella paludicola]BAI60453.1 putative cobalt ABC transporter ATP binding protein [Methanocella paludicola SANAE]